MRRCQTAAGDSVQRGDHPCYRHGEDPKLYVRSRTLKEDDQFVPLRDLQHQIITRADHYREICLDEPWKIPLLFGTLPRPPKADSDAAEKGTYALFSMLLLRPWRDPFLAIRSWLGSPTELVYDSKDSLWIALYDSYTTWRGNLSKSVAAYFSRDARTWLPAPAYDTLHWWNCRVHNILENMDLAFSILFR